MLILYIAVAWLVLSIPLAFFVGSLIRANGGTRVEGSPTSFEREKNNQTLPRAERLHPPAA